jgi:vanillin dehydrogenase
MLGAKAGQALKRTVFELGGFNPMLVLRDANIAEAVNATAFGAFFHQGQICMNTRKVYVERQVHDEFVEKLAVKVRGIKSGNPTDPSNVIGPLISEKALQQCQERVKDALDRGAKLVIGGTSQGKIYAPTILTHVPEEAICTTGSEETFGPVLIIEAVDSAEEALRRAQDTPYGLSAAIMTADQDKGLVLAQQFDVGIIHINASTMASEPSLPNGGVKDSGWGRSGHYAVEDFTEVRLTTLNSGASRYPF